MIEPCVMIVAAEPSGDVLGAGLVAALRRRLGPGARFVGVGGPRMAEEGVRSPFDIGALAILGVFNAIRAYPLVLRRVRETADLAVRERPDVAVLIDSWGFNLRVARRLRRVMPDLAIIKYVAPQVWATRPGRAKTLARAVDRLLSIHVFDGPFFKRVGLPVAFVGNPALARDLSAADPAALRARLDIAGDEPVLLLLPGSRRSEIERLLPKFESAVEELLSEWPNLKVLVAVADAVAPEAIGRVKTWAHPVHIVQGEVDRLSAMRVATVALACSGTVTTELALCGAPMVVTYRLGAITYAIVRLLIRTRFITLFNVAANNFVAPELVQYDCTGPKLAKAVALRLDDPALRARQIAAQFAALEIMRGGIDDPIGTAADEVVRCLPPRRSDDAGG
jgi:lipid-A-disaccharide synthase